MDFNLTEEQRIIQNSAREFLAKESLNIARDVEQTVEGYSVPLWQKMAELGWMGLSFPEAYEGNEGDFVDLVLVLEEMGRVLVPGPFIPSVLCSGHALLRYGNERQRKEYLPRLTKGRLLIAPAFIPPNSTEGVEVEDRAEKKEGGYVLSGTRLFVPYAHVSDLLLYGTKMEGKEVLFFVDAGASGVDRSVLKTIASDRQCEVVLEGVEVSEVNRLGKPSEGKEILRRINEWGALFECSYILGLLEQVLKMTVEYAKNREQFGRPIGSFQAIQHQCADMATEIDQVKFLTYQAAWRVSEGLSATKEISMAKARASDASRRVCLLGIKVHGGIGITEDYDLQLYFRRAKAAELAFGDGDFHREIVARQMGL